MSGSAVFVYMEDTKVIINLRSLKRFERNISSGTHVKNALEEWGKIYNEFMVRRYEKFAAGGGNWRRLKTETVKRKKQNKYKVLIEFGDLLRKLKAQAAIRKTASLSVSAGVTRGAMHRSGLNVADLVTIHQLGRGRVPARQIVVQPDAATKKKLVDIMDRAIERERRASGS